MFFSPASLPARVVLLDPAGNAHDVGRTLAHGNERGATLRFAAALRNAIIEKYSVDVLISRAAGDEEIVPLQIPSFANRAGADFVLRLHVYKEEQEKPKLCLYHLMFHPLLDAAPYHIDPLALIPLHRAHCANIHSTKLCGATMHTQLTREEFRNHFDCSPLQGLPLTALVGITAPAVILEIGVDNEDKLKSLVEPVAQSLNFLK